jgi:hypothetical protein
MQMQEFESHKKSESVDLKRKVKELTSRCEA